MVHNLFLPAKVRFFCQSVKKWGGKTKNPYQAFLIL